MEVWYGLQGPILGRMDMLFLKSKGFAGLACDNKSLQVRLSHRSYTANYSNNRNGYAMITVSV
jgi:hypothetical protein